MAEIKIQKIVGADTNSGCQKRVDITGVFINLQGQSVDVFYDVHLIGKDGSIVATIERGQRFSRQNTPAVMGRRHVEGQPLDVTEEYEVTPASNRFDALVDSQAGTLIKGMLEADLEKYPNF